jgi:aspartate kinase
MPGTVAGIASERDVLVLQCRGRIDDLLELLDGRSVSGKQLHTAAFGHGCDHVTMIVSRENLHDEARLRAELDRRFGGDAFLDDGFGAVSAVGAGINATYKNVRRGYACLHHEGIAAASVATSSFRITWLTARDRIDDAVRALHRTFIEQHTPPVP